MPWDRYRCDYLNHAGYGRPKPECESCTPDLSQPISEPKEISYDAAMVDARCLRWMRLGFEGYVVHLDQIYIGARYNKETGVWMLGRVRWCEECGHFEVAQDVWDVNRRDHSPARITHYAPDVLGTPYDAPAAR